MAEGVQAPVVFQHQYMCSECGLLYNTLEDVLVHQQNHVGGGVQATLSQDVPLGLGEMQGLVQENRYQCLECGQFLLSPDELLHHQELHMREFTHTPAAPPVSNSQIHYQCSECKELFTTPQMWVAHRQKHEKPEPRPQQNVILQTGTSIQALLSLQNVLLDERALNGWSVELPAVVAAPENTTEPVPQGPPMVADNLPVQGTVVQVSDVHPYECSECNQVFHTPEEFLDHQGRHFTESEKETSASPLYSSSENAAPSPSIIEKLRKDWMIEEKEETTGEGLGSMNRVHSCPECKKDFISAKFLRKHCKEQHSVEFPCPDCDRYFTSANRLQSHRRVHVEGNLQCPNCYRVFKKEASLEQHMRVHRGESLYLCVDCGLGFGTEITLILHRKNHMADPLHHCHCGKTFSNMTKFLYHRRTHSGKSGVPAPKFEKPTMPLETPATLSDPLPTISNVPPTCFAPTLPSYQIVVQNTLQNTVQKTAQNLQAQENGFALQVSAKEPKSKPVEQVQRFKCVQCRKEFPTRLKLVQHRRQVHAMEKKHKCNVCRKYFKKQIHLQNHMHTHTGRRPFQCVDCGKAFTSSANLTRHSLVHTGEKPYKCEVCGRSFAQSFDLQEHRALHTGSSSPLSCNICELEFSRASRLLLHQIKHTSIPPYKCPDCSQTFLRKKLFQLHQLEHQGKAPIYCKECALVCTEESQLSGHTCRIRKVIQNKCRTCGKQLNSSSSFNLHLLLHSGQQPFKCHVCGKCFTNQRGLMRHQQWHSGIRPHKCGVCGKAFVAAFSLHLHQRVHAKKRTFPCTHCGKHFRRAAQLKEHRVLHKGERPYRCEDCGKTFMRAVYLAEHKQVHGTERRHTCLDCGKRFKNLTDFCNHRKIHDHVVTRPQQTIMCTELGESIAIIESAQPLPLAETIEIYQAALGGNLQVEDVTL